jgi:hypothetical protein
VTRDINNNNNNNNNNNKACYTYVGEEKFLRGYGGDTRRKKHTSKKCVRWVYNIKIDVNGIVGNNKTFILCHYHD